MLTQYLLRLALLLSALYTLNSCNLLEGETEEEIANALVINEIMASNNTGLMAENDSLYDWIEVKNISTQTVNLHNYVLAVEKHKRKKDTIDIDKWRFPEMELQPNGIVLVFASKRDCKEADKELHTDFKIPGKNGCIRILSKNDSLFTEVWYDHLKADQCYRRLDDGSYETSFYQSPGFENNEDGYAQYCTLADRQRKSPLLIWEAHTKHTKDQNAWVTVKNVSDTTVRLQDYALSPDTYKEEESWPLPAGELAPGKVQKIVCKKKDIDFKSSRSVALLHDGQFADGVCCLEAPFGVSMTRVEGQCGFFFQPSGSSQHYRVIAPEPVFVQKPGVYNDSQRMEISIETHGRKVHYTLDGSLPTQQSPLYSSPIKIDTTTVIRAYSEGDTQSLHSNVATATYFLNEHHTIPVINVSLPHDVLFHPEHGIYEFGPAGRGTPYPHKAANFWKRGYKAAHVEYYDSTRSFSLDCGFAIFGGYSRALSKKSFKLKFDEQYGPNRLDFDVFGEGQPEEFKHLVLRSGSQDMRGVMCRDEFFTSLLKEHSPTLLVQRYQPVALYINARYFGLYYIREKIDKYFAAQRLGTSTEAINIIMSLTYNEEGPKTHYQHLLNYVRSHNLAGDEEYEYMENLVDIDGLIDQKLGQIYSCNVDVGNIRYIRSLDETSDKKWHYVFYDIDLSWATTKPSAFYLRQSGGIADHNVVIDRLLANARFRKRFLQRLSLHMHHTFTPQNTTRLFRNIVSRIRPEMERNCRRWPDLVSYERWEKNVEAFQQKFQTRHQTMLDDLCKELKVNDEEHKKYFGN